jgi:hypothetical protein
MNLQTLYDLEAANDEITAKAPTRRPSTYNLSDRPNGFADPR